MVLSWWVETIPPPGFALANSSLFLPLCKPSLFSITQSILKRAYNTRMETFKDPSSPSQVQQCTICTPSVDADSDVAEPRILFGTVADAEQPSASLSWLLHKVLLRSLFLFILALFLVFYVVYHHESRFNAANHHKEGEYVAQNMHALVIQHQQVSHSVEALNSVFATELHQYDENPRGNEDLVMGSFVNRDDFDQGEELYTNQHENMNGLPHERVFEQHQDVNGISDDVTAVKLTSLQRDISTRPTGMSSRPYKMEGKLDVPSRANMKSFSKIFQDLRNEGLIKLHDKILCLDAKAGKEVLALKKRGFGNVMGINLLHTFSISEPKEEATMENNLAEESFDFIFTRMFDYIPQAAQFVTNIEYALKVGGLAAMHVSLDVWHNKFLSSKLGHDMKPVTLLFRHSKIVYVSTAHAPGLDTVIVFKKTASVKRRGTNVADMTKKHLLT